MLHHGAGLRAQLEHSGSSGEDARALVDRLGHDWAQADVSPADRLMLAHAVRLTRYPDRVTEDDVRRLREEGFDDRAIHDLSVITAYFNFVNRIASGLGVELEPRFL